MLQQDLVYHIRRAAQMHPRPDFTGDAGPGTASAILISSTTDIPITDTLTTSSSRVTATATTTNTDMAPHATFLYPTEPLTLNNIDVIQVSYRTDFKSVDLSIFCEMSPGSHEFALADINQIQSSGTYAIAPIQAGMKIPQFPTYCNFMLCDSQNKTDSTTAAGFTMISTQGIATTYALAATRTASTPTPATQSPQGSAQTPAAMGPTVMSSSAASAAAETAVASTSTSAGLGNGAKAGIAIGVILGICALIAASLFYLRIGRRTNKLENMVILRSTASSVDLVASEKLAVEKPAAASQAPVPLHSPPNNGSGIAAFKVEGNHRNSEDWRRFFGNGKSQKSVISS
ncbi:uncharacterized protein Z519_05031 [Cladophialophora bantiana CBS 173.52]|uniref:Mid2 domain-containing protein n=1 Tax=Cladophialophora bantiana (strain ATCC 10958 / CBS 173.52 / CDC B-1940 / NIH 8579) TaxID=1442370 RepID=A0A0D2G512_CLAB1|nr:uncharacterized protein Z519_05031 [Cladophialophora bantiana CBS 173.52]KIW93717.1 hypothetical protein Z519_05031 [Cladophialophora bantiana CBS 173.52]